LSDADQAADTGQFPVAAICLDVLRSRGETLATAESLTAGQVCATLATVPGASDTLRGGLAAYATDVKSSVLGVDAALIERHGVVSAECAEAMAWRGRDLFAADWAVATTGVAGPATQDGRPVGTVYVAVAGPRDGAVASAVRALSLPGDRAAVRQGAVDRALELLLETVARAGGARGHAGQWVPTTRVDGGPEAPPGSLGSQPPARGPVSGTRRQHSRGADP
jgi:nicotinamide-nucleotide amidase